MNRLNFDDSLFGKVVPNKKKYDVFDTAPNIPQSNDRECFIDIDFGEFNVSAVDTKATFIKGDRYTSIFKARLVKNKIPLNLDGVIITVNIKEGRSEVATIMCEDIDIETSVVSINLPPYLADETGLNMFEVCIHKGEKVIVSQMYSYKINNALGEGVAGTDEESTALQILIQTVDNMRETLLRDIENTKNDFTRFVENSSQDLSDRINGFNDQLDSMTSEFDERISDFTNDFTHMTGEIVQEYDTTLNEKISTFSQIIENIEQDLTITPQDIDDVIGMIGGL